MNSKFLITTILILLIVKAENKCNILKRNGFNIISKFIVCSPTFSEKYNQRKMLIGFPKPIKEEEDVPEDLRYRFSALNGNLIVEKVEKDFLILVTNKHLALTMDGYWILLLIGIIFLQTYLLSKRISVICLFLYLLYLAPVIPLTPFFSNLDYSLSDCEILNDPPVGLIFIPKGLLSLEHFHQTNDWIRIKCPVSDQFKLSKANKKEKVFINNLPSNILGVNHKASNDWLNNRLNDKSMINDDSLVLHLENFKKIRSLCEEKNCWWSGKIISSSMYFYFIDFTLLPGHSGLACQNNASSIEYSGIVQGYHAGKDLNFCSRMSNHSQNYLWLVFPFVSPIILLSLEAISFLNDFKFKFLVYSFLVFVVSVFLNFTEFY